jgi:TolB-like protein/tetratricopeptide (TPR) repeat protein
MVIAYDFEGFRVSPRERLITREGRPVDLPPKAFELLLVFLEHPNTLLRRSDLVQTLWADVSVEEGNLSKCVFFLRQALGNDFIQTISKQGYRFCGRVTREEAHSKEPAGRNDALRQTATSPDEKSFVGAGQRFSVAVLPFEDFSSDRSEAYFGDGLAEEIIHAVAQVPGFRVPARTSSFRFRGPPNLLLVARELNVDTVLEGSIRRVGNRVRVTAQLIEPRNGYHLWSEHYDRDFIDIFSIQEDISRAIANRLKCDSETGQLQIPTRRHTENLEAYAAYLEGRHHWFKLTGEGMMRSKNCFEKAISLDPTYALAHVGLADYYCTISSLSLVPQTAVMPLAFSSMSRALEIDPDLAEGHATIAVHYAFAYDWCRSEKEFKKALQLNPAYPLAHYFYAMWLLRPLGMLDAALSRLSKTLELDPLSPLFHFAHGYVHYSARRFGAAMDACQKIKRLDPSYHLVHLLTGFIQLAEGNYRAALTAGEALQEALGNVATALGIRATAYARAGELAKAKLLLDQLVPLACESGAIGAMVWVAIALNDKEQAFGWLMKAVEGHDVLITSLQSDPLFDGLRADGRFNDILKKMRLL